MAFSAFTNIPAKSRNEIMLHLKTLRQKLTVATNEESMKLWQTSYLGNPEIIKIYLDNLDEFSSKNSSPSESFLKDDLEAAHYTCEGDVLLSENNYEAAISMYTKSIAKATGGSLAPIFAKRSAALKALGSLQNCIADAERAMPLDSDLVRRQSQCSTDLEVTTLHRSTLNNNNNNYHGNGNRDESNTKLPTLSSVASKESPCASDAVAIAYNEMFGRHLVAARDIKIGEVVIVEEAFAAMINEPFWWSHCNNCFRKCLALLPCDNCAWAMFCSEKCRETADSKYHRMECAVLPNYMRQQTGSVNKSELQTLRIIATVGMENLQKLSEFANIIESCKSNEEKRTRGFNEGKQFTSCDYKSVYSLIAHYADRSFGEMLAICNIAIHMLHSFGLSMDANAAQYAAHFVHLFLCKDSNAHALAEVVGNDCNWNIIGSGLYPLSSLINHSCDPNLFRVNYGKTLVHRAHRPIKKGEQLMESYGTQFDKAALIERRKYISKYYFTCSCSACENDWPLIENLPLKPKFSSEEKSIEKRFRELINKRDGLLRSPTFKNDSDFVKVTEEIVTLMHQHGKRLNQMCNSLEYDVRNHYRLLTCNKEP